ncbi:(2Fe-2S) ferredoxin domain-containing protein [Pseudomonas sp. Fl5BN2]|uniref:(2Fe-2S) ferredoxin domain-containing protein n=1 Tax=Pseudomonas sp. Fl5BN2 TaxID=2697652 RepID=UPI001378E4AD|nr:(2Fe-2S) ferredoxin domain-containing protein [Pseudomonas sp. Fl5BN2]NBF06717.1 (2Fe-2S) ferredoxin domain-containing protein [Pseudomonas sp. Fl5BN2]
MREDYQRVLFVGPGLHGGALGEAFGKELKAQRGDDASTRVIDTLDGFDSLWAALGEPLPMDGAALLVVDLEPSSDSAYLDWLRDELGHLARAHPQAPKLWITAQALGRRGLDAALACASIAQRERHLPCDNVNAVASDPDWSRVPPHARQVFLCTGPRCVRRGALPLWKTLRRELLRLERMEKPGGVLLTRTACQFPCNLGPVLTVHPDGCWYRVSNDSQVLQLVQGHLVEGEPVRDLLISGPAGGSADA